jgi:flagellar basal-body rod modification protein FlgD
MLPASITAASNANTTSPTQGTSGTSNSSASSPLNPDGQLTNEATFLQLLVAQIQNQDPLNPTDSIQFVGQLVQFSQLEQLLTINQNLGTLVSDQNPGATPTTGTTTSANTNSTSSTS